MLKRYLLIGLMFCFIACPVMCEEALNSSVNSQTNVEQNLEDTTDFSEESSVTTTPMTGEIDSMVVKSPYENNFQEKTPEQNEFTRAVFMFLKTMLAVALCSIIIFIILLGVKKFYGVPTMKTENNPQIEDNLKPTQTESEALQIFFNKTKNL